MLVVLRLDFDVSPVALDEYILRALGQAERVRLVPKVAHDDGVARLPANVAGTDGNTPSTLRVALEPPTRGAAVTEVTVPSGVSIVVFDLDAREAGAPRTVFDVSLTGSGGRLVMRVAAPSSVEGKIELPLHRSLLDPGPYQFDITHQGLTVSLPVLIQQSTQQP